MKKIGLLGLFGINNTGDNLEAMATKSLLEKELGDVDISCFSINLSTMARSLLGQQRRGPLECITQPAYLLKEEFWESIYDYDALIMGGGGLLVPLPEYDPILLYGSQIKHERLPKTAWNAVGSIWSPLNDKKLSEWYLKIKEATEIIDYTSVRSITTQRLLELAGCATEMINRVPSLVTAMEMSCPELINEIEVKYNLDKNKYLIGISIGSEITRPPLKQFLEELAKTLNQLQHSISEGAKIIIFPVGEMYDDGAACKILADLCPDAYLVTEKLTPTQIWLLVGRMDAYLSMRYHSIISAIAQSVPTLALDCYLGNETLGSKLRDLMWESELEEFYFSPIIEICGEPQLRSFAKIPQSNNISKRLTQRITYLLSPETKDRWSAVTKKQKAKALEHLHMMIKSLSLDK
ncbi:polysaccharide pyruvyl transferase family protein [Ruminiclostridium papyrosolvens]|uniref:Polysaccharide pyruvyl transferase domain-containing protein n=1 Tax=Ruminiclostridium papyrosolvens C7 TaxID=1330534 RepID=U4R057_9FIRM|nr:polysaccharide pyruvyl transferase family protein [Ruminiclostridium papyrosolvens]EPR10506.1 hypothetical protein L323_13000 [Ruminiclostridium papyrosolvens C7]